MYPPIDLALLFGPERALYALFGPERALYPPIDLALFFLGFSVLTSRALFGPERALYPPLPPLLPAPPYASLFL